MFKGPGSGVYGRGVDVDEKRARYITSSSLIRCMMLHPSALQLTLRANKVSIVSSFPDTPGCIRWNTRVRSPLSGTVSWPQ